MVGVAVNVIVVPAHIVVCDAAIETEGVTDGFTVIVNELLVTVAVVIQAALEIITQVSIFPLVNDVDV